MSEKPPATDQVIGETLPDLLPPAEQTHRERFLVLDLQYRLTPLLRAANNFQRIETQPSEETTSLRETLIRALRANDDLSTVFSASSPLSPATTRLLAICLDQELRLGLQIAQLDELLVKDQAGFIGRLTADMLPDARQTFDETLNALTDGQRPYFLRRLSGEGLAKLDDPNGLSDWRDHAINKRLRRAGHPHGAVVPLVTPFFPAQRDSIFRGIFEQLPVIDEQCRLLAGRLTLDSGDFDRIAVSLFAAGLPAYQAANVLNELNLPHPLRSNANKLLLPDRDYKSAARVRYRQDFGHILRIYGIAAGASAPSLTGPLRYEDTAEAEYYIRQAINSAPADQQPFSQEEEVALFRAVEAGMTAELSLALKDPKQAALAAAWLDYHGHDREMIRSLDLPLTKAKTHALSTVAQEGRASYVRLMSSGLHVAERYAYKTNEAFDLTLDESELIWQGMKGMCRAVRKFDYLEQSSFKAMSLPWIQTFVTRAAFRSLNISTIQGQAWLKIRGAETRLKETLARPPTDKDVAAVAGLLVQELISIRQTVQEAITSA